MGLKLLCRLSLLKAEGVLTWKCSTGESVALRDTLKSLLGNEDTNTGFGHKVIKHPTDYAYRDANKTTLMKTFKESLNKGPILLPKSRRQKLY